MSLLNKIFGNKENATIETDNPNIKKIIELNNFLKNLLSSDSYIAKSDYLKKLDYCKDTISYFKQLQEDDLLTGFCKKNRISIDIIQSTLEIYKSLKDRVLNHNELFINQKLESEKKYLDNILKRC